MHCSICGNLVLEDAKFCQACGKPLNGNVEKEVTSLSPNLSQGKTPMDGAAVAIESTPIEAPTFYKTRRMNWIIACFLTVGAAFMLLRMNNTLTAFIITTTIMAVIVGIPMLTAVALSNDSFLFLGMPMYISSEKRKFLKKIMLFTNAGLGLFGLLGLVMCITTAQYWPMVSMLVYVIPPAINVLMLRLAIASPPQPA